MLDHFLPVTLDQDDILPITFGLILAGSLLWALARDVYRRRY